MRFFLGTLSLSITALSLAITASASDSHYVPGLEGVKGSVLPPPGIYYKGYLVGYNADKNDSLPSDSKVDVTALAHRVAWVTPKKVLGGDLAFEAVLPVLKTDLKIAGQEIDERTGLGDLYVGGIVGWHGTRWDVTTGAGYWSDTGDFDARRFASPGKGYGSVMLSLGGNVKINSTGDITFSALSRYEMPNGNDRNDELIVEWGLGKSFGLIDAGLIGYNTFETGDGDEERNALGLSLGYFSPRNLLGGDVAAYKEYSNKNTFEGTTLRASLTKVF
ncbi:transporter [Psychrobacter sp. H8-1]|uniref:SphA family protein n=1 Tax=Psychrobacter sp. H8-1 TaxID=2774129 RepID=UPI00191804AB|nr:transporter [Psychrobacter sp. H8-1]